MINLQRPRAVFSVSRPESWLIGEERPVKTFATAWTPLLFVVLLAAFAAACSDSVEGTNTHDDNADPWNVAEPPPGQPRIAGPDAISFGAVPWDDAAVVRFAVQNIGEGPLSIYAVESSDDAEVISPIPSPDAPVVVEPDEAVAVELRFDATVAAETQGAITIASDDPDHPELVVAWDVEILTPCVQTFPQEAFSFGQVPLGESHHGILRIENCSDQLPLEVSLINIEADEAFSADADLEVGEQIGLPAGESLEIEVNFAPTVGGFAVATLELSTDDPDASSISIRATGTGVLLDDCHLPVIEASLGGDDTATTQESSTFNAAPLDTVDLDASLSTAALEGEVEDYSWHLVDWPQDSGAFLDEGDEPWATQLYLDLAGTYVVELDVADEEGEWACEPARLKVMALVGSDIHVQLVWDTPGDPHRHNDHGTDLDLHFLHPNGQWGQAPWDCNWQNREPLWTEEEGPGNPTLDIDAHQGWGPENVNLDGPEEDLVYSAGAFYFTDRGYGASYATMRVFLEGELAAERVSQALHVDDFWYAFRVRGDLSEVEVVDETYQGFPP